MSAERTATPARTRGSSTSQHSAQAATLSAACGSERDAASTARHRRLTSSSGESSRNGANPMRPTILSFEYPSIL